MWCGGTKIGVKVDLANGDWRLLKIMDSITSSIADASSRIERLRYRRDIAHESLPASSLSFFGREQMAERQVGFEELLKVLRHAAVIEESIEFEIYSETAVIQIRRANAGEVVVANKSLAMVELSATDH